MKITPEELIDLVDNYVKRGIRESEGRMAAVEAQYKRDMDVASDMILKLEEEIEKLKGE